MTTNTGSGGEKTKPIARRWREIRSTKLEIRNKQTTNPRKSAQSAVRFEKTKPISAKTSVSASLERDYENRVCDATIVSG
jgi:hypothetical protein